jgi:hypothetical protein
VLGRDDGPFSPRYSPSGYDATVTALGRRVAFPSLRFAVVVAVLGTLVGCGSTAAPSTVPVGSSPTPRLTVVPGGNPTPVATLPTTTETGFGRIWDDVPSSFPRPSGASVVDDPTPASAVFVALVGEPKDVSHGIEQALTKMGWSVDAGSPLEDGTIVMEATAPPDGCKAEIRYTRIGGSVMMKVLYGAACPFR